MANLALKFVGLRGLFAVPACAFYSNYSFRLNRPYFLVAGGRPCFIPVSRQC